MKEPSGKLVLWFLFLSITGGYWWHRGFEAGTIAVLIFGLLMINARLTQ